MPMVVILNLVVLDEVFDRSPVHLPESNTTPLKAECPQMTIISLVDQARIQYHHSA